MQLPEYLTIEAGYAVLHPRGNSTLEEGAVRVSSAIEFCRERQIPKMLIDMTDVTGLRVPTVVDRFWLVREWAEKARGAVMIAMVVPAELIDPRKFGVMAGRNLGLSLDVFTSRSQALGWLVGVEAE